MVQSQSLCPLDASHSSSNTLNSMPCGLWPNLQRLQLSRSSLIGSLPANFNDSFPQLQHLDTGVNQLTGPLPPTLPPHMTYLDLGGNNFTGSLPFAWSHQNLTLLTVLDNNLTSTIPSIWGQPDVMPNLQHLYLADNRLVGPLPKLPSQLTAVLTSDNQLTGTLPASDWPPQLELIEMDGNRHNGSIPAELASLPNLQALALDQNMLTGTVPEAWSEPDALPSLYSLTLSGNLLSGTLHNSWGNRTALVHLEYLDLSGNNISGTLPDSWAAQGAFSKLRSLNLQATAIHGTLPTLWSSPSAFPHLGFLQLSSTGLHGSVPAFNNRILTFVDLSASNFTSDLGAFWNSSSPLTVAMLSHNSLSGSLPNTPPSLDQLTFLDVSDNCMQGTLPLPWLTAGSFLSHVAYLNVGKIWQHSLSMSSWRQQLCLHQSFYSPDVTGVQLTHLPAILQNLQGQELGTTDSETWETGEVANMIAQNYLAGLQGGHNQLTAVPEICANNGAGKVLLIVWVPFAGCCLLAVLTYMFLCRHAKRSAVFSNAILLQSLPIKVCVGICKQTFEGIGGLAFYYYDLVTSLIVLTQLWGTWPGGILTAIFFVHFATTGYLVAVYACFRLFPMKGKVLQQRLCSTAAILVACVLVGPIMIPVVLLLDTMAFIRQAGMCIQGLAKSAGWPWLRPAYVAVYTVQRFIVSNNCLGLSWVDLEQYESMHNLIAAVFQSLPAVILNSVLFSLGNRPSHGLFFSDSLFVVAVIASCLVMLKVLIVFLWQAYSNNIQPVRYLLHLVSGRSLARQTTATELAAGRSIQSLTDVYHVSASAPLGADTKEPGIV